MVSDSVVPQFQALVGERGIHIRDPVEDVQAILYTDRAVTPTHTETEDFVYPVDSAVELTLTKLRIPSLIGMWIRDLDGDVVTKFDPNEGATKVQADNYLLEFPGMGMKMYAQVRDTGFRVVQSNDGIDIIFDPDTVIRLGARSLHSQPARTLTTTSKPRDLMQAISLFGNAMKTWSPERTYPSLRGHPPLIELESKSALPEGLTPPDTGIRVTTPPEHEWLFPTAPLAYWFGATVEPGPPALHAGGERYPLGIEGGYRADSERKAFESHIKDLLQFTFLFDCAVRTEGFYNDELDAQHWVDKAGLSLDYQELFQTTLDERIRRYMELDASFEDLADQYGRPGWRLTADVQPSPERATILPFLARDLAVVRCFPERELHETSMTRNETVTNVFERTSGTGVAEEPGHGAVSTSSPSSFSSTGVAREQVRHLPDADSMSHAWVGDGFAAGTAKASTKSYLQRLENQAEGTSRIDIDVIVNSEEMTDEASVSEIYGTRDILDFDIDVHRDLSIRELSSVFESQTDFVHYIGHVETGGFECSDGYLDATQLRTVNADTFFLNACSSYEQGQRLVDKGAIAGVVTLEEVFNSSATVIGTSIARLLNYGFPIGSATDLIQRTTFSGTNYAVVGDSNAAIAQCNVSVPNVAHVELKEDGLFKVSIETYASWNYGVGSIYQPYLEGCDFTHVVPGKLGPWTIDSEALDAFLQTSTFPLIGENNIYWSDEISASELLSQLGQYA